MNKHKRKLPAVDNERGMALLTTLMLMVILMLIGMAATDTTIREGKIAANEVSYKQGFYKADSGINYALNIGRDNADDYESGDVISPADTFFRLRVVQPPYELTAGEGSNARWVVRSEPSETALNQGNALVQIEAEIEFAAAQTGMIQGPGNQTSYN